MGCSIKHGDIEYCYQCSDYPCKKYEKTSEVDSFVSYKNVIDDFAKAKENLSMYLEELKEKYSYLQLLIEKYNDGRSKAFFCTVVNNMKYNDLKEIMNEIGKDKKLNEMDSTERAKEVIKMIKTKAKEHGVVYELRK